MAVNSRAKGARGENIVADALRAATGHLFERVPGSGSGKIKGDLHILGRRNRFCIEVKNYAESPLNDKIFTSKTSNLVLWWNKLKLQAKQCGQEPLLLFRYNRSKTFVVTELKPANAEMFIYISWLNCYIVLLDEWLLKEKVLWLLNT